MDSAAFDSAKAFNYRDAQNCFSFYEVASGCFAGRAELAYALYTGQHPRGPYEDPEFNPLADCYGNSSSSDVLRVAILRRARHEGTLARIGASVCEHADFSPGSLADAEALLARFDHLSDSELDAEDARLLEAQEQEWARDNAHYAAREELIEELMAPYEGLSTDELIAAATSLRVRREASEQRGNRTA